MDVMEIEDLREKLNELVGEHDCDSIEVLELSRKMDILILSYMEYESRQLSQT